MKIRVVAYALSACSGLLLVIQSGFAQPVPAAPDAPITIQGPLPAYYAYGQLQTMSNEEAMALSSGATTIPMSSYTVTSSRDGNEYSGVLVGRSPFFHGSREIDVPTFVVPVKIKMPDGGVFDAAVADSTCLGGKVPKTVVSNSPIFQVTSISMNSVNVGTTQYIDAFQRAEFWENLSSSGKYHVVLKPVTFLAEQTFTVPSNKGHTFTISGGCGHLGVMDINAWDNFVQGTLIPFVTSNGGGTTSFPLFLLYNVVMADPFVPNTTSNCCILGYHNAFGFTVQTYGVAEFDSSHAFGSGTKDISVLSHEVGEWANDPLGTDPTPAWGHTGQVSGCQNNLEVADPLSGTLAPSLALNSFTYHPQEMAFFSWFYGAPSLGTGGDFSSNQAFTHDAGAPCT